MPGNKQGSIETPRFLNFITACFFVFFFWSLSMILIETFIVRTKPKHINDKNSVEKSEKVEEEKDLIWARRGTIGDSFGAINSLFTGLAFAGVIYTILLQRADIERQHKESTEQSQEIKRQIRLSIMPAFIASITGDYKFCLLNIGNGTAINIRVQRVDIPRKLDSEESVERLGEERIREMQNDLSTYIKFEPIQLIKKDIGITVPHQT